METVISDGEKCGFIRVGIHITWKSMGKIGFPYQTISL
jgi:hypothetical protein